MRALFLLYLSRLLLFDFSYNSFFVLEFGVLDIVNVEVFRFVGLGLRYLDEGFFGRLRNFYDLDVFDN